MHLRLHLDPAGDGWYFDIDFELDYEDNAGPGYYMWYGKYPRVDEFLRPFTPWEAVVLCVKRNNSQAPLKLKYRRRL